MNFVAEAGDVSVVTVTYYTGPVLFDMLAAMLRQRGLREIILVNNGNPLPVYHQLEALAEDEPRLKLVSGHGNVGFAAGCNRGTREATGEYILILNPDCKAPDDLLLKMVEESVSRPRPHLISCRILDEDGYEQSGSRRDTLTPWRAFVEVFGLYHIAPNHPYFKRFNWHEDDLPPETMEVPVISGAAMLLPREDYWRVGGLDEGYFLHVEDIDFCHRLRKSGGHVYFMPHLTLTHIGATSRAPAFIVEWHKTRSFNRYFFKNFSDTYPTFFLWIVVTATWARFFLQRFLQIFLQIFQLKTSA